MNRSYVSLFLLSLIWGTSFLFIKILNEALQPGGVVFWRCAFGAVTLLIFVLVQRININWLKLPWGMIFLVAIFNNVIPWLSISYAELSIDSSVASVLNALTPISTILIGVFFREKITGKHWLGIIVGYCGILFLVDINIFSMTTNNSYNSLLVLVATVCYGFASHLTRRYLTHLNTTVIAFSTMLVAAAISFIVMMETFPSGANAVLTLPVFSSLLALGCLGSGVAYIFYYYMIQKEGATFASLVTYIVPAAAIFWGYLVLEESISLNMILGLTFILSGVFLIVNKSKVVKVETVNE
jgi:drug/metabolite transporter (DMT)-like permease